MKRLLTAAAVAIALVATGIAPANAQLAYSVTISGHVRAEDGSPLAGVVVGVSGQYSSRTWVSDTTSATGRYTLKMRPGTIFMTFGNGWDTGYNPASKPGFTARAGSSYVVDRTLYRTATISGTIRPGVAVIPFDLGSDFSTELPRTNYTGGLTDATGAYRLQVREGGYALLLVDIATQATAWLGNATSIDDSPEVFVLGGDVKSGINQTDVSFTGPRYTAGIIATKTSGPTATIRGAVVDSTGATPIGYAQAFRLKGNTARKLDGDKTNHNGNYALRVTPGPVKLNVEGPRNNGSFLPFEITFTAKKGYQYRVNAALSVPGQLAGTVANAPAKFESRVLAYDAITGKRVGLASINAAGKYHLVLPAGQYRLKFSYFESDAAQWFGGATTFLDAPVVSVVEGGKVAGVNMTVTVPRS